MEIVLQHARWVSGLGRKYFRVVPLKSVLVVLAELVSQLSLLFSYFLPLKIILFLGSNNLPSYVPEFLTRLGKTNLVFILCLSTLFLYGAHVYLEKKMSRLVKSGARRLLEKSQKLTIFVNQEELAAQAYQRFLQAAAGLLFIILILSVLSFIYGQMAVFVIAASIVWAILAIIIARPRGSPEEAGENRLVGMTSIYSPIAFFSCFALMVIHLALTGRVELLVSIISLLLVRQFFTKATAVVSDLAWLVNNKRKLEPIFFYGKSYSQDHLSALSGYWSLFNERSRRDWLSGLLMELKAFYVRSVWEPTGISDVVTYRVIGKDGNGCSVVFLIRVFNKNKVALATQERTLLNFNERGLPGALRLLNSGVIRGFDYNLLELGRAKRIPSDRFRRGCRAVRERLFNFQLPDALVASYARTTPFTWQKLTSSYLSRLAIAADESSLQALKSFENILPKLRERLSLLPVSVVNQDMSANNLYETETGEYVCGYWGRWAIEPIGSGWPVDDHTKEFFRNVPVSKGMLPYRVDAELIIISAYVYAMDSAFVRQQYGICLDLIRKILELWVEINSIDHPADSQFPLAH